MGLPPVLHDGLRRSLETAHGAMNRRFPESARRVRGRQIEYVLQRSGLFDQEYYSAQLGREFPNQRAAIHHYVTAGAEAGFSVSPLIEDEWYAAAAKKDGPAIYSVLFDIPFPLTSSSPLFDTVAYCVESGITPPSTLGALQHFIATATDDSPLPISASERARRRTGSWGVERRKAIERAQAFASQSAAQRTRQHPLTAEDSQLSVAWAQAHRSAAVGAPPAPGARPSVSIVMPARNRASMIGDAISSVQAQTRGDWELIIVDDGSDDDTLAVIESEASRDPRIVVVSQPALGVSAARNTAVAHAHADVVAFLDSDNSWMPDFLDLALAGMQESGSRFVFTALTRHQPNGVVFYQGLPTDHQHLLDGGNSIDLNIMVVDVELIKQAGGFDVGIRRWVDYDLILRLAEIEAPHFLPFIGADYNDGTNAHDRITSREPEGWEKVVIAKNLISWPTAERVHDRVSIAMPIFEDWAMTDRAVRAVLANSGETDLELILVDNGSRRSVGAILQGLWGAHPQVRFHRLPRNHNFALASNYAAAASTGEFIVFLNNDTEVTSGWLQPLLERLRADPDVLGVQPVLLYPDDTIQAAGTVFGGPRMLPWHFLAGHPREDVDRAGDHDFAAITAACMAMRADDVMQSRGFDTIFENGFEDVDLCLRLGETRGGHFVVARDATVYHHESKSPGRFRRGEQNRKIFLERWADSLSIDDRWRYASAGFDVAHVDPGHSYQTARVADSRPVVVRPPRTIESGARAGQPQLRWAIKTAAHAGPRGDFWGDTFFAADLARALETSGQEVVVDRRDAHERAARHLDDVVVVLRGLDVVVPQPGAVNVLWIISHPELVTAEEVRSFDLVYAASELWAAHASAKFGKHVAPLLQATNSSRFTPAVGSPDTGHEVVFVGSTRGVERPIVQFAVDSGVEPAIYGPGWAGRIDPALVHAERVSPDEAARLYRSSSWVLNDHWPDMAALGFLSNRVFDALAAGARVMSDEINGMPDDLAGFVTVVRSADDIAANVAERTSWPSADDVMLASEHVRLHHSFEARAETLLTDVLLARSAHPRGVQAERVHPA
ncbi:glycosyltransferase [Leifsonia sp. YIM 134122]|uniref:Glycosyltransferase n=1 Tax=Leifsonia stereocauli TaxID=3134136 RepID=A0ABU9W3J7_9MICO